MMMINVGVEDDDLSGGKKKDCFSMGYYLS